MAIQTRAENSMAEAFLLVPFWVLFKPRHTTCWHYLAFLLYGTCRANWISLAIIGILRNWKTCWEETNNGRVQCLK